MDVRKKKQSEVRTVVNPGVFTVHATNLLGWHRYGEQLSLTFVEERGDETDPAMIRAHVVARIAVPLSTVEHMLSVLQSAKDAHLAAAAAPAASVLD